MLYAYDYVSQHGIALKEDYPMPYAAKAGKCMTDSKLYKGPHFRNISEVEKDRMTNDEMR